MNIWERIIGIVAGLVLAWCAVWFGSMLHVHITHGSGWVSVVLTLLLVVLGIVAVIVGGVISIGAFAENDCPEYPNEFGMADVATVSASCVCFGFLFGAIVAPIGNGTGVEAWASPWALLFTLPILPIISPSREIKDFLNVIIHD